MYGPSPSGRRLLGLILMAASISLACGLGPGRGTVVTASPGRTLVPTSAPATLPVITPTRPVITPTQGGGGAVTPELIGTWMQDGAGQPNGNFLRRSYSFAADGTYSLVDMLCFQNLDGMACLPDDSPEAGVATVNGNVLSLTPTTASDEGPRAYQFAVVPDEVTGYNVLQFYTAAYTDEWFWVP